MKNGLLALTLLVPLALAPRALRAQDVNGVDELRSQLRNQPQQTQSSITIKTVNAPTTVVAAPEVKAAGNGSGSPEGYRSNTYQTQPTTLVEDAPYQESKASAVRKKRQNVEDQTENKIVEKLEVERMKDEERRANKILSTMDTSDQPAVVAPVVVAPAPAPIVTAPAPVVVAPAPAPVVVAPTPAPIVVAPAPVEAPAPVAQSSSTEMEDVKIQDKTANHWFVGGYGGVGEYGASNVRGKYGVGFNVGVAFPDRLALELGYTYSRYEIDPSAQYGVPPFSGYSNVLTQMNQSNISLGLKWQVIETRVRPVVGALLDYTHRSYETVVNGQKVSNGYGSNNDGITSNGFDVGVLLGVDVVLTDSVVIGVDWRYMTNLTYSSSSPQYSNQNPGVQPIEELNYYLIGLNARFAF